MEPYIENGPTPPHMIVAGSSGVQHTWGILYLPSYIILQYLDKVSITFLTSFN